jgi:dCTP deaminase
MVLSDYDIEEELKKGEFSITPYDKSSLQPSSYDLHLGSKFIIFDNHDIDVIDVKVKNNNFRTIDVSEKGFFMIHPNNFVLCSTIERVKIPKYLCGRIEGKSSIGRLGLIVHVTAGYIDPGFDGTLTLEMFNLSSVPIKVYPNIKIAQLSLSLLKTPSKKSYGEYGNKYQGQIDPKESMFWKNFEK